VSDRLPRQSVQEEALIEPVRAHGQPELGGPHLGACDPSGSRSLLNPVY
jgi:hypothetical protein